MPTSEFDFVDGDDGGQFVLVGGPMVTLRVHLAKGEVDAAVRLYEETGAVVRAELLTEAETASFDTKKNIAQLFRKARDFAAAAKVFRACKLDGDAAAAYEAASDFAEAAAAWVRAGDLTRGAAAFERAGKTEQALELYRKAGATDRVAEGLARSKRFLEAAEEFRRLGNTHAEFEALRSGFAEEPGNVEVVSRLAEVMLQHGRSEKTALLLTETVRRTPAAMSNSRFVGLLAAALEAVGNAEAAAKVRARLKGLPPAPAAPPVVQGKLPAAEPGSDAYGFLKALPMFADLSFDDMKSLYRVCTLHAFQPGQHLIEPGQPGRGLFLIVSGQVEVFAGADASARLLNTLGVGGYVGEISLLQDGPTSARVTARTAVKVLFISREAFNLFMFGTPAAALHIYKLFTLNLAERVRVLSAAK
ncbi:MAG: cyclic nucleotide-binding domain-containing protein [Myxococcaceae bacterium]|nr:cyclic nucleotide-binding domain-containing protein [Myxococcaceae bacterium]